MEQKIEQIDCFWYLPENKRHCEYCTATCVNAHATQRLKDAAIACRMDIYGEGYSGHEAGYEEAFMRGAAWMKEQLEK